jgi:hypothetical protein
MVAEVPGAIAPAADAGSQAQEWPARSAAYYRLCVIILATVLNFLGLQIFNMLAHTIKSDFRLTMCNLAASLVWRRSSSTLSSAFRARTAHIAPLRCANSLGLIARSPAAGLCKLY